MLYKGLATVIVAAVVLTAVSLPADARARKQKRYDVQTQQTPSLDGRITGRARTCGYDTFQYDGFGVPYGPYCH
jgi:hypothetical protein